MKKNKKAIAALLILCIFALSFAPVSAATIITPVSTTYGIGWVNDANYQYSYSPYDYYGYYGYNDYNWVVDYTWGYPMYRSSVVIDNARVVYWFDQSNVRVDVQTFSVYHTYGPAYAITRTSQLVANDIALKYRYVYGRQMPCSENLLYRQVYNHALGYYSCGSWYNLLPQAQRSLYPTTLRYCDFCVIV